MINAAKIFLSIAAAALLCLIQLKLSAKKTRRIRQLPMIPLSVILMTAGVYAWSVDMGATEQLCGISSFLTNAELLAANIILMLGFVLFKGIFRPLVVSLCKKERILELFSLGFYQYDYDYDEWFLKKRWSNFRRVFQMVVWGLVLFSGLFLAVTWILGKNSAAWLLFFPSASAVVLIEIYSFVNGQTKEEFEHTVLGDEADSRKIGGFYKLREILEQLFQDDLLAAHTGSEFTGMESSAALLKRMKESDDEQEQLTAEYFETGGRYRNADADCVQAVSALMHRKNVVFLNPFYRDLGIYVMLPLASVLLSGKKAAVLCGRRTAAEDVKKWISEELRKYTHMKSLWRVENLTLKEPECEVGILTFTQIYDKKIMDANLNFFHETEFVLMIEPSLMLNTGQVALSILAEEIQFDPEKRGAVYCICDRSADGLIDTLSHLLRTEITDVVAAPVPRCNYTAMFWDADGDFCRQQLFDKQTRYLGNGLELAATAVKNQTPEVSWYGGTKAPVKDIKWIAGQYYANICRYMNLSIQQKAFNEKINFVSALWSTKVEKEQFIIAEDEFCNMFSMMSTYLSRGSEQIFVNVLSENYLLRDYMRCNKQMFLSNPNAVPSLVPDYAKTERNTLLKLIVKMSLHAVSEQEIVREFRLIGLETDDVFGTLTGLLEKYTFADRSVLTVQKAPFHTNRGERYSSFVYSIAEDTFEKYFSASLKNAYYILEDEKTEEGYIDAKLFSHVTQTILPGQYVTYDGKYYIACYVSPQSGVVLRRASDLYDGRKYYRQIRMYFLEEDSSDEVITSKIVDDVEFTKQRMNFHVNTTGYLELKDSHNLRTARKIDLSGDPAVSELVRRYRNKSVLCVKLPDTDDRLRFTVCLLLSEIFKTVFPDGWQYLAAVTKQPDDIEGMLNYMVYPAAGKLKEDYIYIIEDSDIDLGLLEAVERNFMKLMEIAADFLEWHLEKMREPAEKDPVPVKRLSREIEKETKKRSLLVKMFDRIRRLFGGRKEENISIKEPDSEKEQQDPIPVSSDVAPEEAAQEAAGYELGEDTEKSENTAETIQTSSDSAESADSTDSTDYSLEQPEESSYLKDILETGEEDSPDLIHVDGTDIFDTEGMPEDNAFLEESFEALGLTPIAKSRYQKECFLKFGFDEIDGRIRVDETYRYLRVRGWAESSLTLARKGEKHNDSLLDLKVENYCDFCGLPLSGVSYEKLNDGRIRCNDCSRNAITRLDDFRELFYRTLGMMEDFYEIKFRAPISVKMTDARTIAKGVGMIFKPSTQVAARVLGYAQKKNGRYSLLVENGSPRLAAINTMVHELTHIWQYINWKDEEVLGYYGMNRQACTLTARDIVYEGMAMWASVQYLYQIGEAYYASQQELFAESRTDVYGMGFKLFREQYPFIKDSSLLKYSPFSAFPPLEPEMVRDAVKSQCTEKECGC